MKQQTRYRLPTFALPWLGQKNTIDKEHINRQTIAGNMKTKHEIVKEYVLRTLFAMSANRFRPKSQIERKKNSTVFFFRLNLYF